MITYEALCQALDRFNARRRNQAEMSALEGVPTVVPAAAGDGQQRRFVEAPTVVGDQQKPRPSFTSTPTEDTHEIDVDEADVLDDRGGAR